MVKFEPGNLFKMPQILKIPELVSKHFRLFTTLLLIDPDCIVHSFKGNGFHYHDGCEVSFRFSYRPTY